MKLGLLVMIRIHAIMIQLASPAGFIFGVTYQHVFMGWLAYVKVLMWPFSREHALTRGAFLHPGIPLGSRRYQPTLDVIWINVN